MRASGLWIIARLVDDDGERRLQGVRQVADVGARPLDDVLVGFEERVELLLQRLDLLRQADVEPGGLARADGGQALLHLGQREQAEADLEQGERPAGRRRPAPAPAPGACGSCARLVSTSPSVPATATE